MPCLYVAHYLSNVVLACSPTSVSVRLSMHRSHALTSSTSCLKCQSTPLKVSNALPYILATAYPIIGFHRGPCSPTSVSVRLSMYGSHALISFTSCLKCHTIHLFMDRAPMPSLLMLPMPSCKETTRKAANHTLHSSFARPLVTALRYVGLADKWNRINGTDSAVQWTESIQ